MLTDVAAGQVVVVVPLKSSSEVHEVELFALGSVTDAEVRVSNSQSWAGEDVGPENICGVDVTITAGGHKTIKCASKPGGSFVLVAQKNGKALSLSKISVMAPKRVPLSETSVTEVRTAAPVVSEGMADTAVVPSPGGVGGGTRFKGLAHSAGLVASSDAKDMTVTFHLPADMPIGQYDLAFEQTGKLSRMEFVVLFNPWSSKDATYVH